MALSDFEMFEGAEGEQVLFHVLFHCFPSWVGANLGSAIGVESIAADSSSTNCSFYTHVREIYHRSTSREDGEYVCLAFSCGAILQQQSWSCVTLRHPSTVPAWAVTGVNAFWKCQAGPE